MSLFNWFSRKSDASKNNAPDSSRPQRSSQPTAAADKSLPQPIKPVLSPEAQQVDRRVKRHARREQLYVAIRESMTRSGVLSASYKFKVLSLDQRGDQFLVMMDVVPGMIEQAQKLAEVETLLISTAKSLFNIYVTSVYWRTDNRAAVAPQARQPNAVNFAISQPASLESLPMGLEAAKSPAKKPSTQHFDPIHDDEMAAFKQALAATPAQSPAKPEASGKNRTGLRSFTLITGFEDTEMPETAAAPALSATQYGELR